MEEISTKIDLRKVTENELKQWLQANEEPSYRASQVQEWVWKKGVASFSHMTNLSKELRKKLDDSFEIHQIVLDKKQESIDGTIKYRYRLHDKHLIETVLIPVVERNRFTVCVSSQVGCSLSCKFCATGKMKRLRNLDVGEIFDQVFLVNQDCMKLYKRPISNVVYMGMGEPLLAYSNVMESIKRICGKNGMEMSPKRITVSTAGIAKMIRKLGDDKVKFNLALSLHAATDEKRNQIMPINEQNTLKSLMDAIMYFYKQTRNRISFEYIAFQGFNDSLEDANNLANLCTSFPVRINIIEYNPVEGVSYSSSSKAKIDAFAHYLSQKRLTVTVRRSRGKDIDAACGQLANKD